MGRSAIALLACLRALALIAFGFLGTTNLGRYGAPTVVTLRSSRVDAP
jgi:hypothetical protein